MSEPGLEMVGLAVRFSGNVVVDGVTLSAPQGRLTALIGPNGAGKTTCFNACSGLLRPARGSIRLFGEDVTRLRPAARARRGLGRTFQRLELCDSMTVWQNVALAPESRLGGWSPLRQVVSLKGDRLAIEQATAAGMEAFGLDPLADTPVSELSTGQRRLVEMARAVAGGYRVLLLDEPSSGLDPLESERVGLALRKLVESSGMGILLVEHDMALVMGISDYVYVLSAGVLIFEGTPAAVQSSPVVRAAYLGGDAGPDAAKREPRAVDAGT